MAYQPLWLIYYQNHPCRRTAGIVLNPLLDGKWIQTFPKGISPKVIVRARLEFELACLVRRVFANGPGDLGSIPGHVIL